MSSPEIDRIAADWLKAERDAEHVGNTAGSEQRARTASAAYEAAVTAATRDELVDAWHRARDAEARSAVGSPEWVEARAVTRLLRVEVLARD